MASVQTGADFRRANRIENPQNIARVSKKKMRQLVLEDAHDPELAATARHLALSVATTLRIRVSFSSPEVSARMFRPGMNHEIVNAQNGGGFGCLQTSGKRRMLAVLRPRLRCRCCPRRVRERNRPPSQVRESVQPRAAPLAGL